MGCENNLWGQEEERQPGQWSKGDVSARSRNGGRITSQEGFFLVVQKIKVGKGGSAFRLARFYFCNLAIKVLLLVYCLDYLKGLTSLPDPPYITP